MYQTKQIERGSEKMVLEAFQQLLHIRHLKIAKNDKISHAFILPRKCFYRLMSSN